MLRACRLCIICAKPREANTLVESYHLGLGTKISGDHVDGIPERHDFHVGEFELKDGSKVSYYVTNTSRQGIQTFAMESATLFSILKPEFAIHVGVCAAISDQNIAVEDVIFGERALNYEEGKWAMKDDKLVFMPEVKVSEVKGASMDGFIRQAEQPRYKYGDFVSGCAVRMDASFIFDRVRNTALRDVAALDMEASAFLQACECTGVKSLGVIKGVSDMGDHNKGLGHDKHYRPALCRAAEAAKAFIKYKWETMPETDVDRSKEFGVVLAQGYFDNFIDRVVQKLNTGGYKTEIAVKGLRIVLPKKRTRRGSREEDYNVESFSPIALALLVQQHGLEEVALKGPPRQTNVYLKGSFVVDFPTTLPAGLAILTAGERRDKQVELFKESLADKIEAFGDFVRVITWEEFEAL
ncbi:nucleoside phosphorylase domain-containing protein [Dichotomopilus funicola]|uniref:Nucleoside phosphorylase domain-containing protein n=1 Tax=Dichotomopilus funicola TaxID=1934379 RepID=A0AAN6UWI1_9PEZI|nr:nucleoside phosphorylase domain-containing protein [Dichotomopilus funicola]